jgi:carbon monoxide dehydrogenase subunit G
MELSGRTSVAATRDRVWQTLIDPRNVAACAPGIESIEQLDDRRYRATATLKLGFFSVGLTVDLERGETDAPNRVELSASGHAPASEVAATGEIRLSGSDAGPTTVEWHATLELTGAVASLGDGVVQPMATKLVTGGIECLKARLEAEQG